MGVEKNMLWSVKYCAKISANLFLLTCEKLQVGKISSDHENDIMVETTSGDIILDCQIKTCIGWIAGESSFEEQNLRRLIWQSHQLN